MGNNSSARNDALLLSDENVNFDHFQILRNIGKGSFGKVCIVQKKDTGRLFAMKYVSRTVCFGRGALGGVLKEVELLASLEHPFLVNLWFSFQDEEDLFMVCDLLAGGDLRYHLQQQVSFSESNVALIVCELGSALDYLQSQRVLHRDIKPDNILLDEEGHAHITDFNIATRLKTDGLACSMSGTKPYMAPEVFMCALEEIAGYSYSVDWWSLGVVAYEMRAGVRPFEVHSSTKLVEVKNILSTPPSYHRHWSDNFIDLLKKLLNVHPGCRISSLRELQKTSLLRNVDFNKVVNKDTCPQFKPSKDHLNCDPSLELEEMIVETKPLHKKKKRLAKQRSIQKENDASGLTAETCNENLLLKDFIIYNRYKELKRKAMEHKEMEWQKELDDAMANSVVDGVSPLTTPSSSSSPPAVSTASTPPLSAAASASQHFFNSLKTINEESPSVCPNTITSTSPLATTSIITAVTANTTAVDAIAVVAGSCVATGGGPSTSACTTSLGKPPVRQATGDSIDYIDRTPSPHSSISN